MLEPSFLDKLDNLLYIAAADALNKVKFEEDKAILVVRREKGRRYCINEIDKVLDDREKQTASTRVTELESERSCLTSC